MPANSSSPTRSGISILVELISSFSAGSSRAAAVQAEKCLSSRTLPLYPAPKAAAADPTHGSRTPPDSTGKRPQAPALLPHRLPPIVCHPRPDRGSPASWHHPRTSVIPGLTGNLLPRAVMPAYPSYPHTSHSRPDRESPASWHASGISSGSATIPTVDSKTRLFYNSVLLDNLTPFVDCPAFLAAGQRDTTVPAAGLLAGLFWPV